MRFPTLYLLLACAFVGATPTLAQETKVRSALASPPPCYAGQKLTLAVELLAPGYFASAPTFDVPDPHGLVIIPPIGSPIVSSETVGAITYTVQRHEVSVLAPEAGEKVIPPLTVRFRYKRAPLDKESIAATVHTSELKFQAVQPPGTEALGQIISARELTVTETWKPDPATTKAKAGDAFTRTITFSAQDMPGMMFPPFPAGKIDGVAIYPKDPVVKDHSERGNLTGQRVDTITYLVQRPGQYTLPGAKLSWWDLDAAQVRAIELPSHAINVAPNPALASAQAAVAVAPGPRWSTPFIAIALVVTTTLALLLASHRSRRWVLHWISALRPVHLQPLNPPGP
jgi:hypothetical protein